MRQKILAGNWKMNGSRTLIGELVPRLGAELTRFESLPGVVIIPPALFVSRVLDAASGVINVGVQDIACWDHGAYTGEISAAMARDIGCSHALVGHSERRQLFAETDKQVAAKVGQAVNAGVTAILCVGETLEQRQSGTAEQVVSDQVRAGLAEVNDCQWPSVVIAYEPVWAIGTGKTATADDAQAMHVAIRRQLETLGAPANDVSILYGGSVKADNAPALFAQPDIDGGLIGGASLDADEFLSICRAFPGEL